jgi:hypothetical protein
MLVSAQHAKTKAVIDSINQAKWKENSVNVDSLSNLVW